MPRITKEDTLSFEALYKKSYTYLNENFHKFDEKNKIQISIAVLKMAVPQKIEHSGGMSVEMASIQKQYPGEPGATPINRIVEFDIGSPDPTEAS